MSAVAGGLGRLLVLPSRSGVASEVFDAKASDEAGCILVTKEALDRVGSRSSW
jgi:hypothetical protein